MVFFIRHAIYCNAAFSEGTSAWMIFQTASRSIPR